MCGRVDSTRLGEVAFPPRNSQCENAARDSKHFVRRGAAHAFRHCPLGMTRSNQFGSHFGIVVCDHFYVSSKAANCVVPVRLFMKL